MSRTRDLLEKIHIEYQVDGTLNVKELQGTIWNALGHHFFDKWREDVWSAEALGSKSGGKLVPYRQFKCMPELELYAKAHIPLAARRVLAGLRAGMHVYHSKLNWEDLLAQKHHMNSDSVRCVVKLQRTKCTFF